MHRCIFCRMQLNPSGGSVADCARTHPLCQWHILSQHKIQCRVGELGRPSCQLQQHHHCPCHHQNRHRLFVCVGGGGWGGPTYTRAGITNSHTNCHGAHINPCHGSPRSMRASRKPIRKLELCGGHESR